MSVVTNIMLSHGVLEDTESMVLAVQSRDYWLPLTNTCDAGPDVNAWGGNKYPECDVWAGAYNFMRLEETLDYLSSLPWKEPEMVQVFVREQEDDRFSVYEFRGPTLEKVL